MSAGFIRLTNKQKVLWVRADYIVMIRDKTDPDTCVIGTFIRIMEEPSWFEVDQDPDQIMEMCKEASR